MTFPSWGEVNDLSYRGGVVLSGVWGGGVGCGPVPGGWSCLGGIVDVSPQGQTTSPSPVTMWPISWCIWCHLPTDLNRVSDTRLWKHNLCSLRYAGGNKHESPLITPIKYLLDPCQPGLPEDFSIMASSKQMGQGKIIKNSLGTIATRCPAWTNCVRS